ncbi:MAG: MFS transporter [Microbacterium sp.]
MSGRRPGTRSIEFSLVFAGLVSAVVSSLGMLLVPSVAHEMSVSIPTAQWTMTVTLLAGSIATPLLGRLADGPHPRRTLNVSLLVIAVGSVITALAPDFTVFLIGRTFQGIAYGLVPITIVLARRRLPVDRVPGTISTLSVLVAVGIGLGYPLTGLLAAVAGFRAAFWAAAAFSVLALVIAQLLVPSDTPGDIARPLDVIGAVLLSIGLGCGLLVLGEGRLWGWLSTPTLVLCGISIGALAGWVLWERRNPHPLVDLRVIGQFDVAIANVTALGIGAALFIGVSVVSLIAQAPPTTSYGMGLSVVAAGFVMVPLSAGSLAANRLLRLRRVRMPLESVLTASAAVVACSLVFLTLAHDQLWEVLAGMLLFGIGVGGSFFAMPVLISRSVAEAELGSAVSFNQVLRTAGGSIGSAVAGALLITSPTGVTGYPDDVGIAFAAGTAIGVGVLLLLILRQANAWWRGRPL